MARIGSVWAQPSWADTDWASGTWADVHAAVATVTPSGGGRRIYDPDDRKRKTRPLTRRERQALDRAFRERAQPRYVTARDTPDVRKRVGPVTPFVPLDLRVAQPNQRRIVEAQRFAALDHLDSLLERFAQQAEEQDRAQRSRDHRAALARAARLSAELAEHAAWLADAQRESAALKAEADAITAEHENELMMLLLLVHETA